MTYYINPIWFYLMDVCGNLQAAFITFAILAGLVGVIFLIILGCLLTNGYEFEDEDDAKVLIKIKKGIILPFIFCTILTILSVATPSREGMTKMMIASVITQENVESVKGDVKELVDYVVDKATELSEKEKDKE